MLKKCLSNIAGTVLVLAIFIACPVTAERHSDRHSAADWHNGVAAFRSGDLDAAEAAFRAVVKDRPDWYGGYLMLGRVLAKQRQDDDAIGPLERALELAPDDLAAPILLAQIKLRQANWQDAARILWAISPEDLPDHQAMLVYRWRSWVARRVGDVAAALDSMWRAAELAPDNLSLQRQAALTAEAASQGELALLFWLRAADLDPLDLDIQRRLAAALSFYLGGAPGRDREPWPSVFRP